MYENTEKVTQAWKSEIGISYTNRCDMEIEERNKSTVPLINETLSDSFRFLLDRTKGVSKILEVGPGIGYNLEILSQIGDFELHGIDPQKYAIKKGEIKFPRLHFIEGTVFNLPFEDNAFDLIFTRMVLIHVHPDDMAAAMREIMRVTRRYIAGLEYHSENLAEETWRGQKGLLWKQDFEQAYIRFCPGLSSVQSRIMEINEEVYGKKGLYYKHFLLEKQGPGHHE